MIARAKIGISILTNGNRLDYLKRCISSFLENCHYRPLVIGIYSNGSTDGTSEWISKNLPDVYGVEWRTCHYPADRGCAKGTNESIAMVQDCKYQLHLESDFEHLSFSETGVDKMWLDRAVKLLDSGRCDYLYLRRMRDEKEASMHWWAQWMRKITGRSGEFFNCPDFWWSNNPALFKTASLYASGTLPLDESKDGPKGSVGWSMPELKTKKPSKPWLHGWGMFVHERQNTEPVFTQHCKRFGFPRCKYGFLKTECDSWCMRCRSALDFTDMDEHYDRKAVDTEVVSHPVVVFHSNQLGYRGTEVAMYDYANYNEIVLGNKSVVVSDANSPINDPAIVRKFKERFPLLMYQNKAEMAEWISGQRGEVGYMIKSGENNGLMLPTVRKNCVHVVFPVYEPHGDVYAYVSKWTRDAAKPAVGNLRWVNHIMQFPEPTGNMRNELGIPGGAVVFGNIGDLRAMDLEFAPSVIKEAVRTRSDVWFVFVNIFVPELKGTPRVLFLSRITDQKVKANFIATCDAMIHARKLGETHGMAVGEFSCRNKPVITWTGSPYNGHISILGNKGIYYKDAADMLSKICSFKPDDKDYNAFSEFTPENIMMVFKRVFL